MKSKLISALAVCLTLAQVSAIPASANTLEYDPDPKLKALAEELGADTDKINFGYYHSFITGKDSQTLTNAERDAAFADYFRTCKNLETLNDPYTRFKYIAYNGDYSRISLGISILSVLAHNKVITPAQIQAGAETLNDIKLDKSTDDIIMQYQSRNTKPDFDLYTNWCIAHFSDAERAEMLVDTAEKAMEQGRYFLVLLDSDSMHHFCTGIGIRDGKWEWFGKKYDKCILTIDSNLMHSDSETNELFSYGFADPSCIYINSATKEMCVPTYKMSESDKDISAAAFDEDDFLALNTGIAPSASCKTDATGIKRVDVKSKKAYTLTAFDGDGNKLGNLTGRKNPFRDSGTAYYFMGERSELCNTGAAAEFSADLSDTDRMYCASFSGAVNNIFADKNRFGFDTLGATKYDLTLAFEEGCHDFAPHYRYDFSGTAEGDFKAVTTDRGIIVGGSDGVQCTLRTSDVERDEKGSLISAEKNVREEGISAKNSVLIVFEGNELRFFIGENYDSEVQKGDVNCDGSVDASDASAVLQAYSAASTGGSAYVSKSLADMNGDGMVDSSDASAILQRYAESSTSKN